MGWEGGGRGGEKGPVFLERGLFPPHLRAYNHTRIHTRIHAHAYTPVTHPLIRELMNVEVYQ